MAGVTIDSVEARQTCDFMQHGHGRLRATPRGSVLEIQGWVLGKGRRPVAVEVVEGERQKLAEAKFGEERPDIAEAFPDHPSARKSGFKLILAADGSGFSLIRLRVRFEDGGAAEFGSIALSVGDGSGTNRQAGSQGITWENRQAAVRDSEKVLFGRDGWLYLQRDANDVVGQHTGRVRFEKDQLVRWHEVLKRRKEVCERHGALWTCLVAPDKESVYPEHLPEAVKPASRRPIDDFLDVAARAGAPVTYGRDVLLPQKHEGDLYARTDTHWNHLGAYFVYHWLCRDLMQRGVALEPVEDGALQWSEDVVEGDLGSKVEPEALKGPIIRIRVHPERGRLTFQNGITNHARVMTFEREGKPGPSCVLFGESFADYLLVFLKETFQKLTFVHTSLLVEEVLVAERPDVVLSLPLERFLIRVPDDRNALEQLQAVAGRKGGSLPW
ncbi:MAG: alginate O-acetyltransferase AlgX-related protein [Solirubrobacterales bacterium]